MHVLHLDSGRTMGGGQWQVLRLIDGLARLGVESTLLARKGGGLFSAAKQKGWRVEPLSLFRAARKYDLVHAHDARGHTLAALAGAQRLIVARRVAFPIHSSAASRWKYSKATHYIAVSEFVRAILTGAGIPADKTTVVYDGVPLLESTTSERTGVIALPNKTLPGLDIKLTTNLEHDLPRAAAFVYITACEGLGSAILLAMSAGTPVIASNTGGIPEVIRHRENGLLVESDPAAISDVVSKLLADPGEASRLGSAGRQTVAQRFTLDQMVRNTMEVYHRVLGC